MSSVLKLMHKFQNLNNINKNCITNTKYLYDNLIYNFPELPARAVVVICITGIRTIMHMVVMVNDTIYDPSYDIFSLKDVKYFNNVKQYLDHITPESRKILGKKIIETFIEFTKYANLINNKKLILVDVDDKYYQTQANYVEKNFKK